MSERPLIPLRGPKSVPVTDPVDEHREALLADLTKIADGTYLPCTERVPVDPISPGLTANGTRSVDGGEGEA